MGKVWPLDWLSSLALPAKGLLPAFVPVTVPLTVVFSESSTPLRLEIESDEKLPSVFTRWANIPPVILKLAHEEPSVWVPSVV